MRTIFLLQGIPGSGKSTWAKDQIQKEPKRWKRVNRDDLRAMVNNSYYDKSGEEFIRKIQEQIIRESLNSGYDLIIDNTHLVPTTVKKLHKIFESIGDIKVIHKGFNVDIEECVRRNALREGKAKVPEKTIRDMAKAAGLGRGRKLEDKEVYYPPLTFNGSFTQNNSLPPALICDLDGTLCLLNGRNPYDASTCDQDLPNKPVLELIKACHAKGYVLIFVSGREDKFREPTERFLTGHVNLPHQLFMRPTGDMRKDFIIKKEIFFQKIAQNYFVEFVVDDRPSVVRMFRYELGLTVFQINDKEF